MKTQTPYEEDPRGNGNILADDWHRAVTHVKKNPDKWWVIGETNRRGTATSWYTRLRKTYPDVCFRTGQKNKTIKLFARYDSK